LVDTCENYDCVAYMKGQLYGQYEPKICSESLVEFRVT
jgi:hypothetical protein